MPDIVNDGGVIGFTREITINGTIYIADDFKFDVPTGTTFVRTNNKSVPTGQVFSKGVAAGSMTLQLPDANFDPDDLWGSRFTEDEGTFIITQCGRAETKDGETKAPFSFSKAITDTITEE